MKEIEKNLIPPLREVYFNFFMLDHRKPFPKLIKTEPLNKVKTFLLNDIHCEPATPFDSPLEIRTTRNPIIYVLIIFMQIYAYLCRISMHKLHKHG